MPSLADEIASLLNPKPDATYTEDDGFATVHPSLLTEADRATAPPAQAPAQARRRLRSGIDLGDAEAKYAGRRISRERLQRRDQLPTRPLDGAVSSDDGGSGGSDGSGSDDGSSDDGGNDGERGSDDGDEMGSEGEGGGEGGMDADGFEEEGSISDDGSAVDGGGSESADSVGEGGSDSGGGGSDSEGSAGSNADKGLYNQYQELQAQEAELAAQLASTKQDERTQANP